MTAPLLDHVGLNVVDLDAMTEWYCAAFGYAVQHRFDLAQLDLRIVMLVAPDGRRFELLTRSSVGAGLRGKAPQDAASTSGFGHVCYVVDDLDREWERLIGLGAVAVLGPRPAPERAIRMAFVHDPEGNLCELICRTG